VGPCTPRPNFYLARECSCGVRQDSVGPEYPSSAIASSLTRQKAHLQANPKKSTPASFYPLHRSPCIRRTGEGWRLGECSQGWTVAWATGGLASGVWMVARATGEGAAGQQHRVGERQCEQLAKLRGRRSTEALAAEEQRVSTLHGGHDVRPQRRNRAVSPPQRHATME
jgi:hypothetical protein